MDSNLEISLDKLPVKRLEVIEENGLERFPPDVGYDEKTLSLLRRIDFAWAVERDEEKKKKQKKNSEESSSLAKPWPWQSMLENLKLAHQELSVIVDLINTVEANDAVTVASMTRPKPLPNEVMSDLAVSAATKLQCFRHLGKYFKQSAKALEQQVAREARFYGALIRLQQNWKVKKQRVAASAFGNEGFTFDLFDNLLHDPASVIRPSSLSTVRIDHDSAGMLAINLPPNSCQALHFGFFGANLDNGRRESSKITPYLSKKDENDSVNDDECIKQAHSILRDVHQAIFSEQVFDLVNREAFNPSTGYNVTGMRENFLQLSLGQGISVYLSLVPFRQDDETTDSESSQNTNRSLAPLDSFSGVQLTDVKDESYQKFGFPNRVSYEIYLLQIIHEHVFLRAKDRPLSALSRASGQLRKEGSGLLSHFCLSLANRIFSNKVLLELERVVRGVPYLRLISHPTWHCRTSSWTVLMQVPQSILHIDSHRNQMSDSNCSKNIRSQFQTKVVVTDDCINVEGEGTPNLVGLFKGSLENISSMNRYDCDLGDLPVIILQQVASQIIRWLHEEALMVGIKSTRDHLCLSFDLEQGETLSLVAHVDHEDPRGCISWWLVIEDGSAEEHKLFLDVSSGTSEYRKFLGHLSLDVLYSTLMDLVSLCSGGGSF